MKRQPTRRPSEAPTVQAPISIRLRRTTARQGETPRIRFQWRAVSLVFGDWLFIGSWTLGRLVLLLRMLDAWTFRSIH